MAMPRDRHDMLLALRRMASSQVFLGSSSHRPSIATSLIVISACLLPFLALPSSSFFANAFPYVADTFWYVLLSIVKSSRFYFFLLNFLIVTLVCSSRILNPLSKPRRFDESGVGDPDQNDGYSAAHALHVDQFYESQTRSPAYLTLFEGSNIYTADEAQSEDRVDDCTKKSKVKHDLSLSLQGPTFTDIYARDDLTASRLRAENTAEALKFKMLEVTNGSSMEKTLESPPGNFRRVNIGSADHQDFSADRHIMTDETQVSGGDDERDQEVGNPANFEKNADAGGRSDGDEDNRPARHGERLEALEDDSTVGDGLDSDDNGSSAEELNSTLQTPSQKTEETTALAYEQAKDNNENGGGELDENGRVDGGEKNEEEEDSRAADIGGEEKADMFEEGEEMSREELNKRASAFITAFRRKHGYMEGR